MTQEEIDIEYKEMLAGMDIDDPMDMPPPNIPRAVRDYGETVGWDEQTILKQTILIQRRQLRMFYNLNRQQQMAKGTSIPKYGRE